MEPAPLHELWSMCHKRAGDPSEMLTSPGAMDRSSEAISSPFHLVS